MTAPLVTVAMPVYNAMPYLPQAVESILAQTYDDFEFLIVNDGSADGSADYLDGLSDPRVRVIHQDNIGQGYTLNLTLDLCHTPYYARMDADDVALPERLEKQVHLLCSDASIVLTGSQIRFLVGDALLPSPPVPQQHDDILRLILNGSAALCHPALMYRSNIARRVRYRVLGAGEDFDFFLRMIEAGRVTNHSDVLFHYRMHKRSMAITHYDEVLFGMAYACAAAGNRAARVPEPEVGAFIRHWRRRSCWRRYAGALRLASAIQYRRSIIDRAEGRRLIGNLRLGVAGLAQPQPALRRLSSAFGVWRG